MMSQRFAGSVSTLPMVANGGDARFATWAELRKCRADPRKGAWVFGEVPAPWWLPFMPAQRISIKDDRSILILCPSRGGKGVTQLVPNILMYPGAVAVTDPKGELVHITARIKAAQGHKVRILDPFGICAALKGGPTGFESSFDPLSTIDPKNPAACDDVANLVDAIYPNDSKEPYWSGQAKSFIGGMIACFLLMKPQLPIATILDVIGMTDEDMEEWVCGVMAMLPPSPLADMAMAGANAYLGMKFDARGTLKRFVGEPLKLFSSPPMRDVMKAGDWTWADVQRSPHAIYLVLPVENLTSHAAWLRLMINRGMRGMGKCRQPKIQTLVAVDECANLGPLEEIKDGMSIAAGRGMKLVIVIQELAKLREHYPASWQTFFANAGQIVVLGAGDSDTREEVSRLLGTAKMLRAPDGLTDTESDRLTENTVPLMTPGQVNIWCSRDITGGGLILRQGDHPIMFYARPYYKTFKPGQYDEHPDFRENSKPAPKAVIRPQGRAPQQVKGHTHVKRRPPRLSKPIAR